MKDLHFFCAATGHKLLQKATTRYQYYRWKLLWISQIAHCVSKGKSRYLQSSILELVDLISLLQWVLPKWIASWFLMRIMESLREENCDLQKSLCMGVGWERYWRFLVKLREITCEDQDEEVRGCGLCGWMCGGK